MSKDGAHSPTKQLTDGSGRDNISLIVSQSSLHIPGHALLPAGTLFAHPFPDSVHPAESHSGVSVSDLRNSAVSSQTSNGTRTERTQTAEKVTERKQLEATSGAESDSEEEKQKRTAKKLVSPLAMPFPAAVTCLLFNVLVPGSGKFSVFINWLFMPLN